MEGDSFYVAAPSNSSLERYPANEGGHYKVDLPESLHLSPDWEVGLSELTYRRDWTNTAKEDLWMRADTLEYTDDETSKIGHTQHFVKIWKKVLTACAKDNTPFYYYVVKKDKPGYRGENVYLKWLQADRPLTLGEFVASYNAGLKKAYLKAGWTEMDEMPFLDYAKTEHDKKLFASYSWPDLVFRIKRLPRHVSLEDYMARRLLGFNSKVADKKRVFAFSDVVFSSSLWYLLQDMNLHHPDWIKKHGIPKGAKTIEEAKRKDEYKDPAILMIYLPGYGDPASEAKTCEKESAKFFPSWHQYTRSMQTYDLNQTSKQTYKIGKKLEVYESSIQSEQDLAKRIQTLLGSISDNIDCKIQVNREGKIEFAFSIHHHFGFRIEMSHTLYRVLGININQLYQNTYIIPTTFKIAKGRAQNLRNKARIALRRDNLEHFVLRGYLKSIHNADLTNSINTLWIYSDINMPAIVGHMQAPLLRTIPVPHSSIKGETCNYVYKEPFYFPLTRHVLDDFTIQIYDTYGEAPVKFANDVICQLHFRKHIREVEVEEGLKRKSIKRVHEDDGPHNE